MSRTLRAKPSNSFRRQRHLPEKKAVEAATVDGVKVRAKRGLRRLPNPWDDFVVSALYEQDFKRPKK